MPRLLLLLLLVTQALQLSASPLEPSGFLSEISAFPIEPSEFLFGIWAFAIELSAAYWKLQLMKISEKQLLLYSEE